MLIHREQEIAFLTQAYAQVEAVNFELEQYKQECRDLQNQLAQANEEQETLATQLYETGHALDEATAEVCVCSTLVHSISCQSCIHVPLSCRQSSGEPQN